MGIRRILVASRGRLVSASSPPVWRGGSGALVRFRSRSWALEARAAGRGAAVGNTSSLRSVSAAPLPGVWWFWPWRVERRAWDRPCPPARRCQRLAVMAKSIPTSDRSAAFVASAGFHGEGRQVPAGNVALGNGEQGSGASLRFSGCSWPDGRRSGEVNGGVYITRISVKSAVGTRPDARNFLLSVAKAGTRVDSRVFTPWVQFCA